MIATYKPAEALPDSYAGLRQEDGAWVVYRPDGVVLDPTPSQALHNHSPTGFAWGYEGSGPAQLALAILLDYTNIEAHALEYYQDFKREIIARFQQDQNWFLSTERISEWLSQQPGTDWLGEMLDEMEKGG